MVDRETILPLSVGFIVAVILHATVVPLGARLLTPSPLLDAALNVVDLDAPENATAGEAIQVAFTVINVGGGEAAAGGSVGLLLSNDRTPDVRDRRLGAVKVTQDLQPGEMYGAKSRLQLPGRVHGQRYLVVAADHGAMARVIDIAVPPRPDLTVSRVRTPLVVQGDEPFDVVIEVANSGVAPAAGRWTDAVYLSQDDVLDGGDALLAQVEHETPLPIGGRYAAPAAQLTAPLAYRGNVYLIVAADERDEIEEYPHETNNTMAVPIEIIRETAGGKKTQPREPRTASMSPRPDLVVRHIDVPPVLFVDELFKVGYTAANIGAAPAGNRGWIDLVYMSKDKIIDDADKVLTAVAQTNALAPMEHYSAGQERLKMPEGMHGDLFLIVKADGDDEIDESPNEHNNALAVPVRVLRDEDRDEVQLGKDDAIEQLTLAWISHEDFIKMQAPESRVRQPAAQTEAMHDPNAPIEYEPTPPAPNQMTPPQPAKRAEPDDAAKPARQAEAESPLPQPAAEAREMEGAAPDRLRDQPLRVAAAESTVPRQARDAAMLPAARTQQPKQDRPTEQAKRQPPRVAAIDPSEPGPDTRRDSRRLDDKSQTLAEGSVREQAQPAMQIPALAQLPSADALPAKQRPAEVQPMEESEPDQPLRAATVEPQPQGKPSTGKPQPAEAPVNENNAEGEQPSETKRARSGQDEMDQLPLPPTHIARPTAVPLVEKESPLFDDDEPLKIRPGEVLTGNGIEIFTALPKIGIVARSVIHPMRNPKVSIRFDAAGRVTRAQVIESTGYGSWDGPILASIYRWRATGENLRKRNRPFQIEVTIIVGR